MFLDSLKNIVEKNRDVTSTLYLRNLLKETVQLYVLNFIYTSDYGNDFLFKGGTCLRICFDLPRLSEDLDFDIKEYSSFRIEKFEQELKNYFVAKLQYKNLQIKRAKNQKQLYLKFPIMEELGLKKDASESPLLFVRIDVSPMDSEFYNEEITLKSTRDFSFVIRRYSLSDLFVSKISAVLQRTFRKGKGDKIMFKGRDYYDLIWFFEQGVKVNSERLEDITGIKSRKELVAELDEKVKSVKAQYLKEDLMQFFAEPKFVDSFVQNFPQLYEQYKMNLLK